MFTEQKIGGLSNTPFIAFAGFRSNDPVYEPMINETVGYWSERITYRLILATVGYGNLLFEVISEHYSVGN